MIEPQARSSGATGSRTPPQGVPGVPPLAPFAFFLAFLGPEEKKQNLRKRAKVFSGKEKTSRNGNKKPKKPPQNRSGPTPGDLGQNVGNVGPEHTQKRVVWGVWGPSTRFRRNLGGKMGIWGPNHGPGKTRNGDWDHRRVPVAKRDLGRKMGSDRGIRG